MPPTTDTDADQGLIPARFLRHIRSLPAHEPLTKEDLLRPEFLLQKEGAIEVYYTPHNELVNQNPKVVVIGLTPGWTQMELGYRQARKDLLAGLSIREVCLRANLAARFAGTMRHNLIQMLNALGLARYLGVSDCASLFAEESHLLNSSSVWKYPVFVNGENYTGHTPVYTRSPMLKQMADTYLPEELRKFASPLLIPLGQTVERVLRGVVADGLADERQCLFGFPHPSGANGHRHKQFATRQEEMRRRVREFLT
ncbi:hypothetical protein [Brevibacillus dissolubilis]|uniref:hypothetical protein n=1 Tax=Brevibacillus dissolubilis TaxID=1844116 RepID=UPI001116B49C|nr:hypothetical protein [Brevibacillus dissolubilis]